MAVADDKLDGVRGGAELVVSDMRLHGRGGGQQHRQPDIRQ
ncbi:hypothetical protein ACTMU2_37060 [Cupriavidus basilensis]